MIDDFEVTKTQNYKNYILTVNDPYGLVKIEANKGKTPSSLAEGSYTSLTEAKKAIDAFEAATAKPKAAVDKE